MQCLYLYFFFFQPFVFVVMSIASHYPKAISSNKKRKEKRKNKVSPISFSCPPFLRKTLETYLAPLECLSIIINVKVTFDSNILPLYSSPGTCNRKHCFPNIPILYLQECCASLHFWSRNSRSTSSDVCVWITACAEVWGSLVFK